MKQMQVNQDFNETKPLQRWQSFNLTDIRRVLFCALIKFSVNCMSQLIAVTLSRFVFKYTLLLLLKYI